MNLTETIYYDKIKELDELQFISKNLYNQAIYIVRTEFETSGKWIRYNDLYKQLKGTENYSKLNAKCAQQILMRVDSSFKGFFKAIKSYSKNKTLFTAKPKLPGYKAKYSGRNILIFPGQDINSQKKRLENNFIRIPSTKIDIKVSDKVKNNKILELRVIPGSEKIKIELVYEIKEKECNPIIDKVLSIDLGVNNLATCTSNQTLKPIIINGRPLKSINQFYNKKRAEMQSKLQKNQFTSKKISKLTFKRNNKIQDYIHKSSRVIINYCIENKIDTIIIGKNDNWKQNINIGKQNNQNFVSIPHAKFINLIQYKAKLEGIKVILTEESYTSKCSSLDFEKICKHETYKGKRIKRGLFQSSDKLINADVNGSLNIMRKVIDDELFKEKFQSIEGLVFNPIKINLF